MLSDEEREGGGKEGKRGGEGNEEEGRPRNPMIKLPSQGRTKVEQQGDDDEAEFYSSIPYYTLIFSR